MTNKSQYSGIAALSICEGLILALNDHKILPEKEIIGILKDAADSHENATGSVNEVSIHKAVAEIINKIISGGNSVRNNYK